MIELTPKDDNVILKVIEQEAKIGTIIISDKSVAESTLGEVMVANEVSYYRDGTKRPVTLKRGDRVRFAKKAGTGVPEAPDGERWLCMNEDEIYYTVKEV